VTTLTRPLWPLATDVTSIHCNPLATDVTCIPSNPWQPPSVHHGTEIHPGLGLLGPPSPESAEKTCQGKIEMDTVDTVDYRVSYVSLKRNTWMHVVRSHVLQCLFTRRTSMAYRWQYDSKLENLRSSVRFSTNWATLTSLTRLLTQIAVGLSFGAKCVLFDVL
jgi:hypothetical protein